MINKLKGGYNMKTTNIVLTVFLVATLLGAAFAGALEVGDILGGSTTAVSAASVASSISASDATQTEIEIENEIKFDSSARQTFSKGQGWIVTGQKGALLEILFVSKEGKTTDGVEESISKGWLKAGNLKLRLESTANTATSKTFAVTGGDGSVIGTLTLGKTSESYQEGFSVWNGDLDLKVGADSFEAKVTVAIEEKQSEKGISGNRGIGSSGKVTSTTNGILEMGGISYVLQGDSNKPQKLEFKVKGSDGTVGDLILESKDSKNYVGKIRVEGNEPNIEIIKGKVTATLNREGNTLYGPIKIELDGSSATDLAFLEGTIKIALSEKSVNAVASYDKKKISSDDSDSDSDDSDDKIDKDRSGSNSGSDNRGFWKKFKEFFGA